MVCGRSLLGERDMRDARPSSARTAAGDFRTHIHRACFPRGDTAVLVGSHRRMCFLREGSGVWRVLGWRRLQRAGCAVTGAREALRLPSEEPWARAAENGAAPSGAAQPEAEARQAASARGQESRDRAAILERLREKRAALSEALWGGGRRPRVLRDDRDDEPSQGSGSRAPLRMCDGPCGGRRVA